MSVTIRHLILGKLARKAYHKTDDSSDEQDMSFPSHYIKKWGHMIKPSDDLYEGGTDAGKTP